jgi:hypothetical protein
VKRENAEAALAESVHNDGRDHAGPAVEELSARPERKSEPVFGPVHASFVEQQSAVSALHIRTRSGQSVRSATHSIVQNDVEQ